MRSVVRPSIRIAARKVATSAREAERDSSRVDKALQRAANASQVAVLLLAVFGYFYTVLPFYKLAVTEEEVAKKSLELAEAEKKIETARATLEAFKIEAQRSVVVARAQTKEFMVLATLSKDCGALADTRDEKRIRSCVESSLRSLVASSGGTFTNEEASQMAEQFKDLPAMLAQSKTQTLAWLALLRAIRNPF